MCRNIYGYIECPSASCAIPSPTWRRTTPHPVGHPVARLRSGGYQDRRWARRQCPWNDRLACAWLIRRYIDQRTAILWLQSPNRLPPLMRWA
ncbi:chromate resistance protein ChrB domain-containing protein [Zoogloea sp.]|uniref:chromate resistance protein ChrB domain-containing protein n=1 Tax=Zoogloea sp. TaxID=49181 RepID=UPI0035AD9CCA